MMSGENLIKGSSNLALAQDNDAEHTQATEGPYKPAGDPCQSSIYLLIEFLRNSEVKGAQRSPAEYAPLTTRSFRGTNTLLTYASFDSPSWWADGRSYGDVVRRV